MTRTLDEHLAEKMKDREFRYWWDRHKRKYQRKARRRKIWYRIKDKFRRP